MVGAVVQQGLQADERVAGEDALLHGVAQALFDGGKKFLGTLPPKTSSAKIISSCSSCGSKRIQTSPNWPLPPDCFLWRPWASTLPLIFSR